MGFELGDFLKNVSEMDTGKQGELLSLSIESLDEDSNNFYSLDGIDELAANIEFAGLQQPLLVRPGETPGRYTVVSGHRRLAALKLLASEGKDFSTVRCILDEGKGSPELQELKLIMANSDTRRMSPADISHQAERVEELLYKLKEQGVEFPGRMRDHVAEACKVSKSKLARLKAIKNHMAEEHFAERYEAGEVSEAAAYALSQQTPELQKKIYKYCVEIPKKNIEYVSENTILDTADLLKRMGKYRCIKADGERCSNVENFANKIATAPSYTYIPCERGVQCCAQCSELKDCKYACQKCAEQKAKLKADRKAEIRAEKARAEESKKRVINDKQQIWKIWAEAVRACGMSSTEYCTKMHIFPDSDYDKALDGSLKVTEYMSLPYTYSVDINAVDALRRAADTLGCSIDELLGRKNATAAAPDRPQWHKGQPKHSGMYAAKFIQDGLTFERLVYYDNVSRFWFFDKKGKSRIQMLCAGWYPIPEEDEK